MKDSETISVVCSNCGKQLRAPAQAVGKTGKCSGCGNKLIIQPASKSSTPSDSSDHEAGSIAASVHTGAKPTRPSTTSQRASAPVQPAATKSSAAPAKPITNKPPARSNPPAPAPVPTGVDEFGMADFGSADFNAALGALIEQGKQQVVRKVSSTLSRQEVSTAITATLPRRSVSLAYRMHLMFVAVAMALLPLLYVAFVAVTGYGVFHYIAFIMPSLLRHIPTGRGAIIFLGLVIAPAIAGVIMVLFLVKPLFFRIRDERRRRSLNRNSQPLLFELVDRICESTGAPVPQRIDVDYQVNASAQPLGGLWSVAAGKMVLTIGIPLIAGLSSRQLAGVLAHEFGHFSQKIGMGASLIIRKVNFWFMRVVYQRDTMDMMLESLIDDSESWFVIVWQFARLCVWCSRGVLWCFMMLGNFISAGLMRQMEFDADRYEYGLVGSRTFADTSLELQYLGASQSAALSVLLQFFQNGRLADDMISLSNHLRQQLPADLRKEIKQAWEADKGSWLATHPSDRARIARAEKAEEAGCFNLDRPARELVKHYEEICKGVTWDFYRDQLGNHVTPQQLTPTSQLLPSLGG